MGREKHDRRIGMTGMRIDGNSMADLVDRWVVKHHSVGLTAAVVQSDGIAWQYGAGVTSYEDDAALPVTPATLFRICSTTKLLTGTAIMRLVEQGTLDLTSPVSHWLPDFSFRESDMAQRITLEHLLSHTSGLPTFRGDIVTRTPEGLELFIRDYLPGYPFLIPPGRAWLYSNVGLMLAAYIAQSVTGTPYCDLMQELVFDPLEMTRTTFDPLVAMTYPFAEAHQQTHDGTLEVVHVFTQNTVWDSAGGAVSCIADLANLALMYLNGGSYKQRQLLQHGTVQLMQTPLVYLYTLNDEGYGLTFASERYKSHLLVRHNGGGIASYASYFYLAPESGLGVLLLSNGGPAAGLVHQLLDQVLPPTADTSSSVFQRMAEVIEETERSSWPRYAGTYLGIYTGLVEITEDEDAHQLLLRRNGKEFVLHQRGPRQYWGSSTSTDDSDVVAVGFPDAGSARKVDLMVVNDSPCLRTENIVPAVPDTASWRRFVGTYELNDTLTASRTILISLEDDTLILSRGRQKCHCLPLGGHQFACDEGLLAFREGDQGPLLELWHTMIARRQAPAVDRG
jgi:CubicO group peptidase (beta-lactamase class C family)